MPETQTGVTPATPSVTPGPNDQAPNPPATPPASETPPAPPVTDDDVEFTDADRAKLTEAIKAERKLKADAEKLARAEKKRADDLEAAKLTDDEKKAKRLEELEAEKVGWERERQQNRIEQAVGRLATKLKLVDVETVVLLVDPTRVEFEDGNPINVEQLVTDLVKNKPFLVSAGSVPTPPTPGINAGDGTSGGPPPKLTAEELEAARMTGMTPEKYAAMRGVKTLGDWQKTQPPKTP